MKHSMLFPVRLIPSGSVFSLLLGVLLAIVPPARGVGPDQTRTLELKPLPSQRVERLSKETRKLYDLGLAAVDKVNYEKALDNFKKAVDVEPDNIFLRYMVVQMAQYLGDTRSGPESIAYYDLAAVNLKAIAGSPKLNAREKERAQKALETFASMRQSVNERDEKRQQYGMEMAKLVASTAFKPNEKEKKSAEREKFKTQVKATYRPKTLRATSSRGRVTPDYSMNGSSGAGR